MEIVDGIAAFGTGYVHQMQKEPAPVDVPEKLEPEPRAFAGALDDAGDVGGDEARSFAHVDHAEVGGQGGEMVICDLGPGGGDHRKQGGFPDVREAHEAHVGKKLQLELDVELLAGEPRLGKSRRLAGRGGEMLIAPSPLAAAGGHEGLVAGDILDQITVFGRFDQGAAGYADDEIFALLSGAALAGAVLSVGGGVFFLVPEIHQGGKVVVGHEDHAAASAAVAAVGTAGGHVFFTVKGHGAVAALSRLDVDPGGVDEHEKTSILKDRKTGREKDPPRVLLASAREIRTYAS